MAQAAPQSVPQLPDAATEQAVNELAAPNTAQATAELMAASEAVQPALTERAAEVSRAARKEALRAAMVDGGHETTPPAHPELKVAKEEAVAEANAATALQASTADAVHNTVPEAADHSTDASESPAPQGAGFFGWVKRIGASIRRFFGQGGQTAASMVRGPQKAE
ncbi:MAG: translocase FtsK, DNA segregation ATPase FtsK/SpoIIIE, S-DNA-T family protein [Candidatus Peregrinibacteria bacterium GW2011_GWC2_39_14]|nr:MAG: translocase FtsK protein [Candidatus Peregrinibacteria bacterium GW2011_GWA2_38_36]KKR07152.1 MAG: translocase FtsK, DNA segregation ATPase FtsK/SpoIIIE, S-DNA-T family protein [Candidatus Peregrinibacteria bacterium GW2011_GWC2_39_14]